MIIGRICIKLKSNDIIKFLIGQFDLIMGQIKFLLCLKINLGPIEGLSARI
jgi:hypothetical protein